MKGVEGAAAQRGVHFIGNLLWPASENRQRDGVNFYVGHKWVSFNFDVAGFDHR